ncbi:MAG: hypothetical protein WA056_02150 [Gallionella sp.]
MNMTTLEKPFTKMELNDLIEQRFADYESRLRSGKHSSDSLYLDMCLFFDGLYERGVVQNHSMVWDLQCRLAELEECIIEPSDWK